MQKSVGHKIFKFAISVKSVVLLCVLLLVSYDIFI